MDAWYSGLLPYPVLLPIQLVIVLVQVVIDRDVRRDRGFFSRPRPRAGRASSGSHTSTRSRWSCATR